MVNRICGSGLISIICGANAIKAGYRNVVLCGGFESMSRAPHYLHVRKGVNGNSTLVDGLVLDGLTDAHSGDGMGLCTERVARRFGFTRAQFDDVALRSYTNAIKARDEKILAKEIVEVKIKAGILKDDEELTKFAPDKMKKLKSAFCENGVSTAANASKISDGAQGVLIMGEDEALKRGIKPRARIVAYEEASAFPGDFTVGAIDSAKKVLKVAKMEVKDMDFFEFNEAFSILPLLGQKLMNIDINKVNVHGGAVALGHPLGYSCIFITLIE